MKHLITSITLLAMLASSAQAMSVMIAATGPYNYNCDVFREGKRAGRAEALIYAQGWAAAKNMDGEMPYVNLRENWREFNKRVVRICTDKTTEYLHRRFVNDAAEQAIEEMRAIPAMRD
jgi:hypothetical protein